jgi:hypothetical protein
MPKNIVDADVFTSPVVVPVAGEPITEAERTTTAQALANRTSRLGSRAYGMVAGERVAIPFGAVRNLSARFDWASASWEQSDVTTIGALVLPFGWLPKECVILGVGIRVDPGTGRAGLPGTMPDFDLRGTAGVIDTYTDASASVGAYETAHDIASGALAIPYAAANGDRFAIEVHGEAGANSQTGLLLLDAWVVLA